jgi:hypothetical protein
MALFYDIVDKVIKNESLKEFQGYQLFFAMNAEDKKYFHKKFGILSKHMLSPFSLLNERQKELFLTIFQKSQKIYRGFCKVAANYKIKRYPINVDRDIYFNKLERNEKTVINIFQNKQNYLFKTSDLLNLIETSLCNSHSFFLEPKFPVNPYNNIPFSFADLYNLYFTLKNMNCVIPKLFNSFFLSDFNIELFLMDNELDVKERIIYKYVYCNNDVGVLHMEFRDMMRDFYHKTTYRGCRKMKKIVIDKNFPKNRLIEIMKPYLYLYCSIKYSVAGVEKIENYKIILKKKMKEFVKFNPMFGRKYTIDVNHQNAVYTMHGGGVLDVNKKMEVRYDDKHETFTLNDIKKWGKPKVAVVVPVVMTFRPQPMETEQRQYVEYNEDFDFDNDSESESESEDDYESLYYESNSEYESMISNIELEENRSTDNQRTIENNDSRIIVPNYPMMPPDLLSLPFPATMNIRTQVSENAERFVEVPINATMNTREVEEENENDDNGSMS